MKVNREKTWLEIIHELEEAGREDVVWKYVTVLRGPDFGTDVVKRVFTAPLRCVTPYGLGVNYSIDLDADLVKVAFEELAFSTHTISPHYINHLLMVWEEFSPRVYKILDRFQKQYIDIPTLALDYMEALREWLERTTVLPFSKVGKITEKEKPYYIVVEGKSNIISFCKTKEEALSVLDKIDMDGLEFTIYEVKLCMKVISQDNVVADITEKWKEVKY